MNADDGCMREDVVCGSNDVGGPKCGNNGLCVGSFLQNEYRCNCKPGYRGHQCQTCKKYKLGRVMLKVLLSRQDTVDF